jgi:arsenate reductase
MSDATITIFHNPACGTSRNTLALIRNSGVEPVIVEYLKTPPGRAKLVELVAALGVPVRDVLRQKGTPYDDLKLGILPSPQLAPFAKEDGEPVIDADGKRTGHRVAP